MNYLNYFWSILKILSRLWLSPRRWLEVDKGSHIKNIYINFIRLLKIAADCWIMVAISFQQLGALNDDLIIALTHKVP